MASKADLMSPRYWYRVQHCRDMGPILAWYWTAGEGAFECRNGFGWTQAQAVKRAERAVRKLQKRDHEVIEWTSR